MTICSLMKNTLSAGKDNFASSVDNYLATTRIASVDGPQASSACYTLDGIRAETPQNGVYIQDGKKRLGRE